MNNLKNEDNLVPSLDIIKLKKQYYKENPRLHVSHTSAIDSFSSWLRQEILIQNGVETNKEQPKECDCANQSKIGCHNNCNY